MIWKFKTDGAINFRVSNRVMSDRLNWNNEWWCKIKETRWNFSLRTLLLPRFSSHFFLILFTSSRNQGRYATKLFFAYIFSFFSLLVFILTLRVFIIIAHITQTSTKTHTERERETEEENSKYKQLTTEHISIHKKAMQQHQRSVDRQRVALSNINHKTKHDDFYTKLERIRLSAAASSSSKSCKT